MPPEPDANRPSPAGAGVLLLTTMALFGAAGGGAGSLVGAFGLLLTLGIFIGLVVGIWVVYTRYRDL
jgi:hypothetical protein